MNFIAPGLASRDSAQSSQNPVLSGTSARDTRAWELNRPENRMLLECLLAAVLDSNQAFLL